MKKKPIKIAYVALVLAVCAFPVFTMPLFGETGIDGEAGAGRVPPPDEGGGRGSTWPFSLS